MASDLIYPSPFVFLGRCLMSIDVAISFGEHETWQYTKCPLTRHWIRKKGIKSSYCFYPVGSGETA